MASTASTAFVFDEPNPAELTAETRDFHAPTGNSNRFSHSAGRWNFQAWIEIAFIFGCFVLFAGQLPPDVNESHYLTKAKHFWDPEWCAGDIFLSSSFAHWLFYVATGWLTAFLSLEQVAWTGRLLTWAGLAISFRRLSWSLLPARGISIVAAMIFLVLNERFHLAGEWVVGGFEAKGLAYLFVLLALSQMVDGRWSWTWPLLGLACAFHVLVGGWATIAVLFALLVKFWQNEIASGEADHRWLDFALERWQKVSKLAIPIALAAVLAAVGVLPPLLTDRNAATETIGAAQMIYVNQRIAHHLTFDAFPAAHVARFTLLGLFGFLTMRWLKYRHTGLFDRLHLFGLFCVGSLAISLGGLMLSGLAEQDESWARWSASLLRFYWFRLADFAVPLGVAFSMCSLIGFWLGPRQPLPTRICACLSLVCVFSAAVLAGMEKHDDPRPRADRRGLPTYEDTTRTLQTFENWKRVCQWIASNTPVDAVFITPHEQQTFKWYAGRAEVVSWKDVPQDASGIVQWYERLQLLYEPQRRFENGLMSYSDQQLIDLAKQFDADYIVLPQRHLDLTTPPSQLAQVYPVNEKERSTYVVLKLPID